MQKRPSDKGGIVKKPKPEDSCTALTPSGRALARRIDAACADASMFDVVEVLTRKLGQVLISRFTDYRSFEQAAWGISCHIEQIGRGHFKPSHVDEPESNVVDISGIRPRRGDKV